MNQITIPYTITLDGCLLNGTLKFPTEPFHSRESLTSTLRGKVLRHVSVEFDEKSLDNALNACNSVVESLERTALDEDATMPPTPPATLDEYENERLNYGDEDEDDDWLNRHNGLCHIAPDRDEEYDTEALIKTVMAYEYYR